MKKTLHLLVFVLALATAVALAQTSSSGTNTQTPTPTTSPSATSDQGTATVPASQDTSKHDKNKASVDDGTLNTQIREQLAGDAALKNVQATVSNGVVNLDGTVATKADKKRAKQLVAGIPGVRKVHDRLTVIANATATPGSNEPASASAGATGTTTSSTTSSTTPNTAGSIAGNAGASSTTPQTPTTSATGTTTRGEGGASANGMPQSDVSAGASAGVSGSQSQAGGVSGSTSSTVPQSSTAGTSGTTSTTSTIPQSSTAGTSTGPTPEQAGSMTETSDLQKQIQIALRHEPTLANDKINAVVSDDTIDLSGSVATGKERQTALRVAQSFAGNRRVVDHLTVAAQGPGASMGEPSTQQDANPSGASNPSATPSSPNASPGSTNNPR